MSFSSLQLTLRTLLPGMALGLLPGRGLLTVPIDHLSQASLFLLLAYSLVFLLVSSLSVSSTPSLYSLTKRTIQASVHTLAVSLVLHTLALLFGAPLLDQSWETYMGALFIAIFSVYPVSLDHPISLKDWSLCCKSFSSSSSTLPLDSPLLSPSWLFPLGSALFGAWLGAMTIPLDWDRPWQRWPIPCVVGAAISHTLSLPLYHRLPPSLRPSLLMPSPPTPMPSRHDHDD
ncbi:MAG: GPI biosynthesis protein family Pig-F-domain-containing protein [Piptocephalis tieghemiana]|nr:MAG: GPI biosynthesis protein family Pig-F-domain-containing protein [Piptocephalis tieghemiana]